MNKKQINAIDIIGKMADECMKKSPDISRKMLDIYEKFYKIITYDELAEVVFPDKYDKYPEVCGSVV